MAALLAWRREPLLVARGERAALVGMGALGYGLAALVIFTFATGAARMPNSSQWPLLVSSVF